MLANAVHPDLGPRHHVPVLIGDQASHHTPAQGPNRFPPFTSKNWYYIYYSYELV